MPPILRNQRDHEILRTLARKARMMSLAQIAGHWWEPGSAQLPTARARLLQLHGAGFVDRELALVRPPIDLLRPVFTWSPGGAAPNFVEVSNLLRSRWPQGTPTRVYVYFATEATNNQYGGARTPRFPKKDQIEHDLHVAALYLKFVQERPDLAERWVGEDARRRSGYGLKDPDALIPRGEGQPPHVIEFGGRYDPERVEHFHKDCEQRDRSYELW